MLSSDADQNAASDPIDSMGPAASNTAHPDGSAPPLSPSDAQPMRRQDLEQYLKSSPSDISAYLELAAIYRSEDRPAESVRVLKKAMDVHPDEPNVLWKYEEAMLARSLQQLREARELAARLDTTEAKRERERSEANWAFRRIDVCRARLERDPVNNQLRLTLARTLQELEMYDEAIAEANIAASQTADAPMAHLIRAECLQSMGRIIEALPAYRAAALRRCDPASPLIRVTAMRAAVEIAELLNLELSLHRYQHFLQLAEKDLAAQGDQKPDSPESPLAADAADQTSTGSIPLSPQRDHYEPSDR